MPRNAMLVVAALLAPSATRAGGVVEEVGAGTSPATAAAPGSRWISDKLAGYWDVSERWQLRLDLSSTRLYSDATDTHRSDLYTAQLAASLSIDDHWSARLTVGGSPSSTTHASIPIAAQGLFDAGQDASIAIRAQASSLTAGASVDYDTASEGVHALAVSLSFTATYASTEQALDGAAMGDQTLDAAAVRSRCQRVTCSAELTSTLMPQWVQLGQFSLGASLTDTVDRDTDLSLDAAYFLYDRDPMEAGYLALASVGLGTLTSATGMAPLRDSLTPSVAHRWGDLSASASISYTDYTDNLGLDLGASLRVQYKLALSGPQRLKLFAKLGVGLHIDSSTDHARSGSAGAGAQYTW